MSHGRFQSNDTDSISWWRHAMETFFAWLALCEWKPCVHCWILPPKAQECGALVCSLYLNIAWTSCWTNSRFAGHLWSHSLHVVSLESWVEDRGPNMPRSTATGFVSTRNRQHTGISASLVGNPLLKCFEIKLHFYHFATMRWQVVRITSNGRQGFVFPVSWLLMPWWRQQPWYTDLVGPLYFKSALSMLMAWCFSTRASATTMRTKTLSSDHAPQEYQVV